MSDVISSNERVYRCFFCDEEFRGVDATNHFGKSPSAEPACKIKSAGEFALLQALRNAEDELSRHRAEDSDTLRAMHSMIADHQTALRREEEKGYERGLRDARATAETKAATPKPEHVCGMMGYNGMIDPPCPACSPEKAGAKP